jgi:hypothetical protein
VPLGYHPDELAVEEHPMAPPPGDLLVLETLELHGRPPRDTDVTQEDEKR